ncbi:AAA family ATPase [archaeon SCG-AAA382B04]|nr:AAA family ATPase [archaeon SCG-AAA382B04]
MNKEEWTEKYRPTKLKDVVGNKKAKKQLKKWGDQWEEGEPNNKVLRLVGPPGVGKTTSAYALAKQKNWQVMEMNASDKRTSFIVKKLAGGAAQTGTLSDGAQGMRLVIIDEADNLHGRSDRGGKAAITKVLKQTNQPMILIANDEYDMSRGMRSNSKKIEFKNPNQPEVVRALQKIAKKEGIKAYKNALREIARNASGDVRGAINDLQTIVIQLQVLGKEKLRKKDVTNLGRRDRKHNIWKMLNHVFRKNDFNSLKEVKRELDPDITPDELLHWIDDNIPKRYNGNDLFGPMKHLAKASIYLARVSTSGNYSFWSYASQQMTFGVMVDKPKKSPPQYNGPKMFGRLSKASSNQQKQNRITRKIADTYFYSETDAKEQIPYLSQILENNQQKAVELARTLRLDEDEIEYLGGDQEIYQKLQKTNEEHQEKQENNQISLGDFG